MIFPTHRFGNVTRHADLILSVHVHICFSFMCVDLAVKLSIVEADTHKELLKREGSDYARLWRIQAQAFL